MLSSTCSIRLPTLATVKFLSRLFTALNLLPSIAYGLRKQAQSTAQLDELAAHRSDRRAVVSTEVGDGLEVWSQSARQPYQLNIALSLSLKVAARLEPIGWVKLGPGKGLPWVILSGIWYKALLILGNYIRN
jgi:hypothetical protein